MTGGVWDGGVKARADGHEERMRGNKKEKGEVEMMDGCYGRLWHLLTGIRDGGEQKNDGFEPEGKKYLATGRERVKGA